MHVLICRSIQQPFQSPFPRRRDLRPIYRRTGSTRHKTIHEAQSSARSLIQPPARPIPCLCNLPGIAFPLLHHPISFARARRAAAPSSSSAERPQHLDRPPTARTHVPTRADRSDAPRACPIGGLDYIDRFTSTRPTTPTRTPIGPWSAHPFMPKHLDHFSTRINALDRPTNPQISATRPGASTRTRPPWRQTHWTTAPVDTNLMARYVEVSAFQAKKTARTRAACSFSS